MSDAPFRSAMRLRPHPTRPVRSRRSALPCGPASRIIALALGAVVAAAPPLAAQQGRDGGSGVGAAVSAVAARVDTLIASGDAAASMAAAEAALARWPDAYELHWRAARAATALSLISHGQEARQDSLYRAAIAHAQAAVDLRPDGLDGLYWRVASKGRLSLSADARGAADLASQIDREARALLALDSLHAGAHNALGRLNLEIMILPRWKRTAGRLILGGALDGMSWETAERHLFRAVQLEPGNALYVRDLGALHYHLDRPTAARILFERLQDHRGLLPWDEVFRDEARLMLADLEGDAR